MRDTEVDYIKQCEKGDKFYRIKKNKVILVTITEVTHHTQFGHYSYKDDLNCTHFGRNFGTSLFKTQEECEKELLKRQNIKEKRERLKEYERKLNEELNLGNHYIIK